MFRIANLRDQAMAEAEFRIMLMRDEPTREGEVLRRFYPLTLQFDRLIRFRRSSPFVTSLMNAARCAG